MSKLKWTTEPPTKAGWYWQRIGGGTAAYMVEVTESRKHAWIVFDPHEGKDANERVGDFECRWAGPISEPEEKR